MNQWSRLLQFLLLIGLLASCSQETSVSRTHSFQIHEKDGVTIVETRGGPKYLEPLFKYEQVLLLNENPDNPESLLYSPTFFLRGRSQTYYVADQRDCRIAVYGQMGQYSHSIGQKGNGPGDINSIMHLSIQSDCPSVFDASNRRLTRYTPEGYIHDIITIPSAFGQVEGSMARQVYVLQDGRILVLKQYGGDFTLEKQWGALLLTASLDTLFEIMTPSIRVKSEIDVDSFVQRFISIPYAFEPNIAYVHGTNLILSTSNGTALQWYDMEGHLVKEASIVLPSKRFTRMDRTLYSNPIRERLRAAEGSSSLLSPPPVTAFR